MIRNPLHKTYWIVSLAERHRGFGVTAFSREDAFALLHARGYALSPDDPAVQVTEDVQVADLDQNHIVPNMGPMVFRGVWYPLANL
jgi:hypothetical protein